MYTYPSFLSGYVQNVLGAGSVLVGMIVGSYGFVQMLLRIPLGICSDRVKKRRVFVQAGFLAAILSGAGLSLVALAAARGGISPMPVLFLRGLSGGGAAAWVAFSVLAADQAPPDKTGEAMSRISFFQNMATVAAMPLGSWVMTRFGAAWAFALAAAAGAAGLILISGVEDLPPRGEAMTVREICTLAKNRKLIAGTLLATLFQLVTWATVQGFTQNWALEYVSGFDDGKLGMLAISYMLPNALVCRISGGYLSKKTGVPGRGVPGLRGRGGGLLSVSRGADGSGPSGGAGAVRRGYGHDTAPFHGAGGGGRARLRKGRGDGLLSGGIRRGHVPGAGAGRGGDRGLFRQKPAGGLSGEFLRQRGFGRGGGAAGGCADSGKENWEEIT